MVREVGFDEAYTFKFSPREGTPATKMPAEWTVPDHVASERLDLLIGEIRSASRNRNLVIAGRLKGPSLLPLLPAQNPYCVENQFRLKAEDEKIGFR